MLFYFYGQCSFILFFIFIELIFLSLLQYLLWSYWVTNESYIVYGPTCNLLVLLFQRGFPQFIIIAVILSVELCRSASEINKGIANLTDILKVIYIVVDSMLKQSLLPYYDMINVKVSVVSLLRVYGAITQLTIMKICTHVYRGIQRDIAYFITRKNARENNGRPLVLTSCVCVYYNTNTSRKRGNVINQFIVKLILINNLNLSNFIIL